MNILITGGTGFIGSELCPVLQREGHYLTIVTREPKKYKEEEAQNQKFVSWDSPLIEVMEWADAVINLAGENIFGQRWNDRIKKRIYHSRVDNTKKLVEAILEADQPPEVMISGSAVGYYGGAGKSILKEVDPPGNDFLANVCAVWEKTAERVQQAGVRLVTVRTGIVLEKEGGMLAQLLPFFRLYVGGPVGPGTQYVPWIHRRDYCRALVFLMEDRDMEGPFNIDAPNPVTMNDFAAAIGDVLNRPSFFRAPEFLLNFALGDAAQPALASLRVRPERLTNNGFKFSYNNVREALSEII